MGSPIYAGPAAIFVLVETTIRVGQGEGLLRLSQSACKTSSHVSSAFKAICKMHQANVNTQFVKLYKRHKTLNLLKDIDLLSHIYQFPTTPK